VMKCIVIGAGAWGLPAAAELVRRGHQVTLVDRHGVLSPLSSSSGPSRLWRLADPDPRTVRLSIRALEAMRKLQSRTQSTVFLRRGLLWRDDVSLPAVDEALRDAGVAHTLVSAEQVGAYFPGLRPDGRDAVWQPEAGVVLAKASLQAQFDSFLAGGGVTDFGAEAVGLDVDGVGVRVDFVDGRQVSADVVVVAAGTGAPRLLDASDIRIGLRPYLEQVVHFGDPSHPHLTDEHPCLFDGPSDDAPGIYAMPSPGIGFKVGLDTPLRDLNEDDHDREPDADRTRIILERVRRDISSVPPIVLDAQVCSWTDSPDGRFIVDASQDGIVWASGDSGAGFKYSALMGDVLADLAEGLRPDPDIAALGLSRFAGGIPPNNLGAHAMGR
jgi:sarcosine oxidase